MPYLHSLFSYCLILAVALFASNAHSAEWRECEKAKLHELRLQQGSVERKTTKSKKRHAQKDNHQSAEEIDSWLWKNCREFSYELRQLEQDRM